MAILYRAACGLYPTTLASSQGLHGFVGMDARRQIEEMVIYTL
jgi:hypothetical protein